MIIGGLGGLAVTWLFPVTMTGQIFGGLRPDQYTVHGVPVAIMMAAHVSILFWGPLTLVAVAGYWMRRRWAHER